MSVILRPVSGEDLPLLPFIGALSVSDALRSNFALAPSLRWPNDVMIDGLKIAGVRTDSGYRGRKLQYVVIGTGVNCNFHAKDLGEASFSSTTLLDVLREKVDIPALRQDILDSFAGLYLGWERGRKGRLMKMVRAAVSTVGMRVRVERLDGTTLIGKATGLNDAGALILRKDGGRVLLRVEQVERLIELGA
jgi:BirA family biotin operon repressor/biotin-[acetyl-CoA-carboxylase] ligase